MASILRLIDDIDGSEGAETRRFSVGDVAYEIDLSPANSRKLDQNLAEFIKNARSKKGVVKKKSHPAVKIDPAQARIIKDWAKGHDRAELVKLALSQGVTASDRGRLPLEVLAAAWDSSHPTKRTEKPADDKLFSGV